MKLGIGLGLSSGTVLRRSVAFTPASISGIVADFDADVGISTDTGVSAWTNQATANHLSQASPSNQPTLVAEDANFNGHASVNTVSGDEHYMVGHGLAQYAQGSSQAITIIEVCRHTGSGSGRIPIGFGRSDQLVGGLLRRRISTSGTQVHYQRNADGAGGASIQATSVIDFGDSPIILSSVYSGAAMSSWTSGTLRHDAEALTSAAITPDQFAIGGAVTTTVGSFASMSWTRILIYSRAITTEERGQIEAYLSTRYGIALS